MFYGYSLFKIKTPPINYFVKILTFFFSILGRRCQSSGRRRRRQWRRRQLGRVGRRRRRGLDDRRTLVVLDLTFGGRSGGHERVEAFRYGRRTENKGHRAIVIEIVIVRLHLKQRFLE